MSYIDTIAHQTLGSLAGIPVYWPKESRVAQRGAPDFGCTPQNLVLGGGSGEHPALVVHHLDTLAAHYLLYRLEKLTERLGRSPTLGRAEDFLMGPLYLAQDLRQAFEHCGWGLDQSSRFWQDCADPNLVATPYDNTEHDSFEHWLAYSLGEFIWFHRPVLLSGPFERTALQLLYPIRALLSADRLGNLTPAA